MKIEIDLTEAESKALAFVAVDPEEWVNVVVKGRCQAAMEEMFQLEVQKMLADPNVTEIPADREAVVLAANLPTAAERHEISLLEGI
jgi:hypothetical protein